MANTGNLIELSVPDIEAALVDFLTIQLERAASPTSTFTLITSLTLVTDTAAYSYQDTAGGQTDVYRWRYANVGTATYSQYFDIVYAAGAPTISFRQLMRLTASRLNLLGRPAGNFVLTDPSGVITTGGSATAITATAYADSLYDSEAFTGWFLEMLTGARAGDERRIASLAAATGVFTLARALGGNAATNDTFDLWGEAGSAFWRGCVNEAFEYTYVAYETAIAGVVNQSVYALPSYVTTPDQITDVVWQSGDLRQYLYGYGFEHGFTFVERPGGGLDLVTSMPLGANAIYLVRGWRQPGPAYADTDVFLFDRDVQTYVTTVAAAIAARNLATVTGGSANDAKMYAAHQKRLEAEARRLVSKVNRWRPPAGLHAEPLVAIGNASAW